MNYIFTGRFQPLHKGHIAFLEKVKEIYPNDLLIICIIRNSIEKTPVIATSSFYREAIDKQKRCNNPLPNWERYMLLKLAIDNSIVLRKNTIILFRNRPEINWENSISDLPKERIWLLPEKAKEKFDEEKYKYYLSKKEKIMKISLDIPQYSGTLIRKQLLSGNREFDFLPDYCVDYFNQECLKYF